MNAPIIDAPLARPAAHAAALPHSRRLIEEWLPITEIGIESLRERSTGQQPPDKRLHVWWARRPLCASRAAVLGSLLPDDADRAKFLHILGIHGDPVAAKLRIAEADKSGERLGAGAYGYARAFSYNPSDAERAWIHRAYLAVGNDESGIPTILDSTAGGGSIPFEAARLGCNTVANDLNPVSWLVLKATVELPAQFGPPLVDRVRELGRQFTDRCRARLAQFYPAEPLPDCVPDGYLWARTITCPYCGGIVPLSPNWRLNNQGAGCRMAPAEAAQYRESAGADGHDRAARRMRFEIVQSLAEQSPGSVKGGDGLCPFPDCGRVIDSVEIKAQAVAGKMGEQLYAVVYTERKIVSYGKNGKPKFKKTRGFRAPRPEDEVGEVVDRALAAKMPEWQARNIVPDEEVRPGQKTGEPLRFGMPLWRDMFSPRQLYGHCTSVEVFHELVDECSGVRTGPTAVSAAPTAVGTGPTAVSTAPTGVGTGPTAVSAAPTGVGTGPTAVSAAPTAVGAGPTAVSTAPTGVGTGPTADSAAPTGVLGPGHVGELDAAALTYIAIAIDKILNYNSRMSVWMPTREVVANTFNRHDFAFCWSHAEMAPTVAGLGYDWTIEQTGKALEELIELSHRDEGDDEDAAGSLFTAAAWPDSQSSSPVSNRCHRSAAPPPAPMTLTRGSGDDLPHIADGSVDAVVLDPPYYDNVMYAELADFFYVWLKRTAGLLYPEHFQDYLTDKDREAVANPAKFKDFSKVRGSGGSKKRAGRDYQERMQGIFAEARRVLKPDGIMTLMFTHKATGAWDALARGLVDAGFVITASWPVHTEAEGSLHIKDKNAAKSTIFLVCRPRGEADYFPLFEGPEPQPTYWEDVEPKVKGVVLKRVAEFQAAGIGGVDLYLACFGPALQVFSENWPMIRGRAAQKPPPARGAQLRLMEEEEFDPYAVRPEDALMAARSAVKQWRLEQLSSVPRKSQVDAVTEWFVLAWDAFKSPQFPADEALKLARVVGVSFDEKLRGKVLEVKGGDVIVWDSALRAKKGALGSIGGGVMIDALHQAAHAVREKNLDVARTIVERAELDKNPGWLKALEYVLNVLPTPRMVGSSAAGPIAGAAADAEALEKLRRLMFAKEVPVAKQWELFA